jgi:hypothetical protein
MEAAKFQPKKCVGYELSIIPYFWAQLKALFYGRGRIKIYPKDFFRADIRDADIVYIYLVPSVLGRVAQKLKRELRPGTIVLSKGSPLPELKYCNKISLDDKRNYLLYIYKMD